MKRFMWFLGLLVLASTATAKQSRYLVTNSKCEVIAYGVTIRLVSAVTATDNTVAIEGLAHSNGPVPKFMAMRIVPRLWTKSAKAALYKKGVAKPMNQAQAAAFSAKMNRQMTTEQRVRLKNDQLLRQNALPEQLANAAMELFKQDRTVARVEKDVSPNRADILIYYNDGKFPAHFNCLEQSQPTVQQSQVDHLDHVAAEIAKNLNLGWMYMVTTTSEQYFRPDQIDSVHAELKRISEFPEYVSPLLTPDQVDAIKHPLSASATEE